MIWALPRVGTAAVAQKVPGSAQYGVKALFFDVFGTLERRKIGPPSGIVGNRHQHADAAHLLALLRTHRKRPRRRTLSCPRQPLSRGSSPCGYPHEPLVSYRINRQLFEWNLPPLVIRAFGALCQKPTHALQRMRPPTEAVSQIKKKTMSSATTAMLERLRGGLDHYGS